MSELGPEMATAWRKGGKCPASPPLPSASVVKDMFVSKSDIR